jgi:putative membrane protein
VVLTLPISFITLGFFILVLNAITFSLAAWFVPGFHISSFGGAFMGAIITSITSWLLNALFSNR